MLSRRQDAHGRCFSPVAKLEIDLKLAAADSTLIFAFSFARTLSEVLMSPEFPGWLAPITADPLRLSTTMNFAGGWAAAWAVACLYLDTFAAGVDDDSMRRIGPLGAVKSFALAVTLLGGAAFTAQELCSPALAPPFLRLTLENVSASLGIGLALIAWRELVAPYTRYW